jgi:MmyB-like transcription regulator ligand binding domain
VSVVPIIANWDVVARSLISRVHREIVLERDPATRELLSAILSYPDVPKRWSEPNFEAPQDVIIPIEMRFGDQTLRFFSTIATLGSPHDIALQELRIESFHPADEATADIARSVAARAEL